MVYFYRLKLVILVVCKYTCFASSFIQFISTSLNFGVVDHCQNPTDKIFNVVPFQIESADFIISDYAHHMCTCFDMDWHEHWCKQTGHQITTFHL